MNGERTGEAGDVRWRPADYQGMSRIEARLQCAVVFRWVGKRGRVEQAPTEDVWAMLHAAG